MVGHVLGEEHDLANAGIDGVEYRRLGGQRRDEQHGHVEPVSFRGFHDRVVDRYPGDRTARPCSGLAPATTLVPHSIIRSVQNDPCFPVIPCTTTVSFPVTIISALPR